MENRNEQTGYASIDRPWRKFYSKVVLDRPLPECGLFENVYENNKGHRDSTALTYWGNRISYGKLFDSVASAKDTLRMLGVSRGDVVSFISVVTPEFVYLFYACNMLGAVANMIDPRLSVPEKTDKLTNTATKVLFVLDACADDLAAVATPAACVRHIVLLPVGRSMGTGTKVGYTLMNLFKKHPMPENLSSILLDWDRCYHERAYRDDRTDVRDPHIPAAIFYTGGTTGEAKGVALSTYNINSIAEQFRGLTGGFRPGDSWLTLSVPFIAYATVCSLHLPLSLGLNCVIELYDLQKIARSILNNRIRHISVTPLLYTKLLEILDTKKQDLSFLEMPISGGDKLSASLYHKINQAFEENSCSWNVCSGYGMTEVSSAACVSHKDASNKPGSSGIPFPQTVIAAFDPETDEECRIGETGELRISGPGVMLGYYNNPEKTAEILWTDKQGNRWIRTGDLGYVNEDGCVFIQDRIKRLLIKYDGFKVFPAHVEEAAQHSRYVDNCCCVKKSDTVNQCGELPVLFVKLKDGTDRETALADIRECCRQELAEYSRPDSVEIIDAFPVTHAGKIDYRALERKLA